VINPYSPNIRNRKENTSRAGRKNNWNVLTISAREKHASEPREARQSALEKLRRTVGAAGSQANWSGSGGGGGGGDLGGSGAIDL